MYYPKLRNLILFLAFWSAVNLNLNAQTGKFLLTTDKGRVEAGETFILEAVLENVETNGINLPDLVSFKILQGPFTSTSISIVNGSRSSSITYRYMIMAMTEGRFDIGPAIARVGNKNIKSNVVSIQVMKGVPPSASSNNNDIDVSKESLIRLEVSENPVYIGQQVVFEYVLYTRQNLSSYQLLDEPDFSGFYAVPLQDIKEQPERKTINGKEYHRQVLKKIMLYPQKSGTYTIGPVNGTLEVPVEGGRSSFFFRDVKTETTKTNIVKIKVQSLPEPAPKSFSGAVGEFRMNANINKQTLVVGEAVVLKMEVDGDGDPKIVQAPLFDTSLGLDVYDPSIAKDETYVQGDKGRMNKIFEYIFIPKKDTVFSLSPEFSYFSTVTKKYETLKSGPFKLTVVPGQINPATLATEKDQKLSLPETGTDLVNLKHPFFGSGLHYGLLVSILFIPFGMWYFRKRKAISEADRIKSFQSSRSIAERSLENARKYMDANQPELFFAEISTASQGYLQKKYNIPNMDAGIDSMKQFLSEKHISTDLAEDYIQIQNACEVAKFAGKFQNMEEAYRKTEAFISKMEAQ